MTILGQHTVHELDDLVKALGYEVKQLQAAGVACRDWMQRDPQGYAAWNTQLLIAMGGWAKAASVATTRINETPQALWDAVPAEPHFQGCLDAFHPFDDLTRQFMGKSGCPVDMAAVPQPTASDFDLKTYQAANKATTWIEQQGKDATSKAKSVAPVVIVGVGVLLAVVLAVRSRVTAMLS